MATSKRALRSSVADIIARAKRSGKPLVVILASYMGCGHPVDGIRTPWSESPTFLDPHEPLEMALIELHRRQAVAAPAHAVDQQVVLAQRHHGAIKASTANCVTTDR